MIFMFTEELFTILNLKKLRCVKFIIAFNGQLIQWAILDKYVLFDTMYE